MKDETILGPWVRRFLLEHLVAERNLSRNTQASYRDTLALLLPFASKHGGRAIDRMAVEDLTPSLVRKFLDHLEHDRQCSGVTRNQRLATIRSLARFIGMRSPAHLAWCAEIRATPFKKTAKTVIGYLEKAEMDALLAQPERRGLLEPDQPAIDAVRNPQARDASCRTGEQDGAVAGDETREPAHNPAHDRCPSVARRRRHQHDPRLARSRVSRHDTYLRRGRHGNEGESAGPGRYLRPAKQAPTATAAVADDVPESPVVAALLKIMLRVKPGKPDHSLACAT